MWLKNMGLNFSTLAVTQHSDRRGKTPRFVTIHYSVSGPDAIAIGEYFKKNPQRKASYHFGVSAIYDPSILTDSNYFSILPKLPVPVVQYVDTDRAAWSSNSGKGAWTAEGKENPNYPGINIVLANWGFAHPERHHKSEKARHRKGGRMLEWEMYAPASIYACAHIINELKKFYPLEYVCGHEDHVSGKVDPGPLFPWSLLTYLTGLPRMRHDWKRGNTPGEWIEV